MSDLVRFGVSIDENLLKKYDRIIEDMYDNRSEAIRDLIRDKIIQKSWQQNKEEEVAGTMTLLYDHHKKGLTEKMLKLQHENHSLFKSNLHIHISHNFCLEVIIVQGQIDKIQKLASKLIGLKGVKHGDLSISSTGKIFSEE